MAHKVLSKDMAELVSALKLAEKYSTTTLDNEYRKYESQFIIHYYYSLLDVIPFDIIKHCISFMFSSSNVHVEFLSTPILETELWNECELFVVKFWIGLDWIGWAFKPSSGQQILDVFDSGLISIVDSRLQGDAVRGAYFGYERQELTRCDR